VQAADPEPQGPLKLASDAEVAEALVQFKKDFKARGIPKEDVVSQRNWAMKKIARLQHPDIIEALAKITKYTNKDLRTLALIYLGDQKLHPYLAAKPILAAMKKHKRDRSVIMTGLQSLCLLKYLGARREIAALLKNKDFAVKKLAISSVGAIKDIRMLKDVLRLLGVDVDATSSQSTDAKTGSGQDGAKTDSQKADSSKKGSDSGGADEGGDAEAVEPGYSWDGVDVFVPQGEDPEAAVRAAQEESRSKAEAAAGGTRSRAGGSGGAGPASSGGTSPSGTGASSNTGGGAAATGGTSRRGSGTAGRSPTELIPVILLTLKKLTGVKFREPGSIKLWMTKHAAEVRVQEKVLDRLEKAQKEAGK